MRPKQSPEALKALGQVSPMLGVIVAFSLVVPRQFANLIAAFLRRANASINIDRNSLTLVSMLCAICTVVCDANPAAGQLACQDSSDSEQATDSEDDDSGSAESDGEDSLVVGVECEGLIQP